MVLHRTSRGQLLDMEQMMNQNQDVIALGNAKMNARGDILGSNGQIVKKREDIVQEYYKGNPNATTQMSLKDGNLPSEFFQSPEEVMKQVKEMAAEKAAKAAQENPVEEKKSKKIVEKED